MKKEQISLNPYLNFNGNCREAMTFYRDVFEGDLNLLTFRDYPLDVAEKDKDLILHATLSFGDAILMASDAMPGQEVSPGSNVHVSVSAISVAQAERVYTALAREGVVIMPFGKTFWGEMFGMLTDRFGINWMVGAGLHHE